MLRIGKLTDYAMLILSQLSKNPSKVSSASNLAESLHLSLPTVSKILKMLSEAKLLTSLRGAEGGYLLAKNPDEISVAAVITAMEGELAIMECCESINNCSIDSICAMRTNWQKINTMIHGILDQLSIIDMVKPISQKHIKSRIITRFRNDE